MLNPKRKSKYGFDQLDRIGAEIVVPFAAVDGRHPNHVRGQAYNYARRRRWTVTVTRSEERGGHVVRRVA